jgi:beta-lactamase superfamily II metal-dependent hydrolase
MGYEIDYLPAGEGNKSADAICLRYGNLHGPRSEQVVVTVDGGTIESGEAVANHIKNWYGTNVVDIALLSHPDTDHASGMHRILELLTVNQVVMHQPWKHSASISGLLDDNRVTSNSIREKTKRNLSAAREIERIANNKGIPIVEPFAGSRSQFGLTILGPTQDFYRTNLVNYKFMPGSGVPLPTAFSTQFPTLTEMLHGLGSKVANWIEETWFSETSGEPPHDSTSPENNSSVIFMIEVEGKRLLFTGDAGVPALQSAISYCDLSGISLSGITFFDVPHHGSRRNLGPAIMNRLFGQPRLQPAKEWTAFISAAKDGAPKHPNKRVTNALARRGASVHVTAGMSLYHQSNGQDRGWAVAPEVPFHYRIEADE